ncbi:MAG TPA: MATE family efflux transporter [Candidatus Copromonas avistercoris]|nr:MATE family efflux transporter [Candidatus Copromonas avistercoris]
MQQENKMGVMPVNRLILTMSLPMILSMLVQALYNIVDSMFVSRLSENALTAVSLAFPAQNLMIAVATGTGVGVNAALSRSLGERNFDRANKIADHAVFLAIASYAVFAVLGLFFSRQFFLWQTDIEEIVDQGTDYLRICTLFSFGLFLEIACERLLQSTGKTIYSMYTQGLGAIINIIFDPIMIFGLFGFPKMGVAGAAAATVFGQILAAVLGIFLNKTRNQEIHVSFRGFRPNSEIIRHIYSVGIPSIIMSSIGSVMTFGMNKILIGFTSTATAVFGVYFKLQSFVFMPVFGLNNGTVPIIAYNYGAAKPDRILKTLKLAICYAVGIMLIGFAVFQLLPDKLLLIFEASENMLSIGVPALRIISVSFLFAGYCIVCSSMFQALGHGLLSLLVSVFRQLLVLLPSAFLLSKIGGLDLVWYSFPIAEICSIFFSTYFLRHVYKKEIEPLKRRGEN